MNRMIFLGGGDAITKLAVFVGYRRVTPVVKS